MLRLDTGPLTILIASLLAEPHGRGQLWTRKPATSPTWWPTFPGVDGFHEDNGVFRGSILGGADQADSRLSFVVPLLELILGDLPTFDPGSGLSMSLPRFIAAFVALLYLAGPAPGAWHLMRKRRPGKCSMRQIQDSSSNLPIGVP